MTSIISYSPVALDRGHPDTPSVHSNPPSPDPETQSEPLNFNLGNNLSSLSLHEGSIADTPRLLGMSEDMVRNLERMRQVAEDLLSARPNSIVFEPVVEENDLASPQELVSPQGVITPPRASTPPVSEPSSISAAVPLQNDSMQVEPAGPSPRSSEVANKSVESVTKTPRELPEQPVAAVEPPVALPTAMTSLASDAKRSSLLAEFDAENESESGGGDNDFRALLQALNESNAQIAKMCMEIMNDDSGPKSSRNAVPPVEAEPVAQPVEPVTQPVQPVTEPVTTSAAVVEEPEKQPSKLTPRVEQAGATVAVAESAPVEELAEDPITPEDDVTPKVSPRPVVAAEPVVIPPPALDIPSSSADAPLVMPIPDDIAASMQLTEPVEDVAVMDPAALVAAESELHAATENLLNGKLSPVAPIAIPSQLSTPRVERNDLVEQVANDIQHRESKLACTEAMMEAMEDARFTVRRDDLERETQEELSSARAELGRHYSVLDTEREKIDRELKAQESTYLEKIADLEKRLQSKEHALELATLELEKQKQLVAEKDSQIAALSRRLNDLDERYARMETEIKQLRDQRTQKELVIAELKRKNDEMNTLKDQLSGQMEDMNSKLEETREALLASKSNEVEHRRAEAEQNKQLNVLRRTVQALSIQMKKRVVYSSQPRRISKLQFILLLQILVLFLYVVSDWGGRQMIHTNRVFT